MESGETSNTIYGVKTSPHFVFAFWLFLVAAFSSACNIQYVYLGPVPHLGPPIQKEPAQNDCRSAACPEAAVRAPVAPPGAKDVKAAKASPSAATGSGVSPSGQTVSQAPSSVGPRLSTLIARDELEKLAIARVVFNVPEQMRVGVKEKVEAQIPENLVSEFTDILKGIGVTNVEDIQAGSSLKARLAGDGFEVNGLNDDEQVFRDQNLAPWSWEIIPVRSGVQPLQLIMTVNIRTPGIGEEKKELSAFSKTVTVAPSPIYSAVRFVKGRWPWMIGILFAAGIPASLLRKRRS